MYEQHPVPQQISSYQFRLVGNMNIKQFFQVAAGAIVALIIYGLPFPGFIKWPLIIIAALAGAAFAFLPIQDRPLEQWLFAFFRSIYNPTYFVWQAHDTPPQYFKQPDPNAQANIAQQKLTDTQEQIQDLKQAKAQKNQPAEPEVLPDFVSNGGNQLDADVEPMMTVSQQPVAEPEQKEELVVPDNNPVEVEKSNQPVQVQQPAASNQQDVYTSELSQVSPVNNQQANDVSSQAQFSPDAAPPLPPELPNTIKGQVMDSQGHIVDGAILEIKDKDGRPVRALRTNKAGHFQIVTSLPDGEYTITTEKEGLEFTPLDLTATGEIIQPIAIRANA